MHFIKIHWDNNDKLPYVLYRDNPTSIEQKKQLLKYNQSVTISIGSNKYCIGHYIQEENCQKLCNTRLSHEDKAQCFTCRAHDTLFFLPLDMLQYQQFQQLKQYESINYINIFGNNLLKTGVTSPKRKFTRMLEQGAYATFFFAATDGYTSRLIESYISKNLQIKQAFTWPTKLKYLAELKAQEEAEKILQKTYQEIKETLPLEFKAALTTKIEFYWNYEAYNINLPDSLASISYKDTFSPNDIISGKIIGIYGEIILLQNAQTTFAINTKTLRGHIVNLSSIQQDCHITAEPKQISLYKQTPQTLNLFDQ